VSQGAGGANLTGLLKRLRFRWSDFHRLASAVVQLEQGATSYCHDE